MTSLAFRRLASVARRARARGVTVQWPCTRWQEDPVGFAHEVLGVKELWSAQVELLESIRDHRNTTCASGHKVGKTISLAIAALWFWASFENARVLLTAVKQTQVENALWRDVRRLYRQSRTPDRKTGWMAPYPLDGEINDTPRAGLKSPDERQIFGMTARSGEGLAGFSSENFLLLADEASGIGDLFFEVLGSSLASDGGVVRKCYISNPTRTDGEFFRSHHESAGLFNRIAISSEDTPNARGTGMIKGLAGRPWIAEKKIEYGGVDSAKYRIRVLGQFVKDRDGKILSLGDIEAAKDRWDAPEDAEDSGPLQLGVDPAGPDATGDETAIAVRRGNRIVTVFAKPGLSEDAIVSHALSLLRQHRQPSDLGLPRIAVDAGGGLGTRVVAKLRAHLDGGPATFELIGVRSGEFMKGSREYRTVRDALWGQTAEWIRMGGAIPTDTKLEQDLHAPAWHLDTTPARATDKRDLRRALGRSTDRGDAVALAIWGYRSFANESDGVDEPDEVGGTSGRGEGDDYPSDASAVFNPYGGAG